jgi:hypothetical protein
VECAEHRLLSSEWWTNGAEGQVMCDIIVNMCTKSSTIRMDDAMMGATTHHIGAFVLVV